MSKFPEAVCLYLRRPDGRVLAVSRKGDRIEFGLPGGKVDPGETQEEALIREVREETGLEISKLRWAYTALDKMKEPYLVTTFLADEVKGNIQTSESGVVEWVTPQTLSTGPFFDYNTRLFSHLASFM